jgi:predicted  nucleic acid-binding Zn-ribbon protein
VTEPTEPTVEAKYASLVAESDEEKRRSDTRIKDQSETIGILENDKYRLQEQNTALQAAIADLEKKLVKKSRTIDQQTKLISQQEKALAAMAMKFALGDVDTTSVVPKIEPD